MKEEQESIMSTRTKINNLIDNIQSRLNKRNMYNIKSQNKGNIDLTSFQSFGSIAMPPAQNLMSSNNYKEAPNYNNYIS